LRRARRVRRGGFLAAAAIALLGAATSSVAVRAYRATARQAQLREIMRRAAANDDPLLGALILAEFAGQPEPPGGLAAAVQIAARQIPRLEYRGHRGIVNLCAWSPDDQYVASVGYRWVPGQGPGRGTPADDVQVHIWRSDGSGTPVVLTGHEGYVDWVRFSTDGKRLLTWSEDGTSRIWHVDGSGTPIVHRQEHMTSVSPDGLNVLTPDTWSALLWAGSGRGEQILFPAASPTGKLTEASAELSPDGSRVLVAGDGLGLWQTDGTRIAFQPGAWAYAEFSPDGSGIMSVATEGEVWTWRADLTAPARLPGAYSPGGFSADGRRIVYGFPSSRAPIFGPDGRRLAINREGVGVIAADGTGPVVKLKARPPFFLFDLGHHASFSPDGLRVLVPGTGETQLLWADGLGQPVTLAQPDNAFFSHDGTRILGCGEFSDRVRIWPAGDPPGARFFHGHQATVVSAIMSPDGRTLLTGSLDGTARLWPIGGGAPVVLGEPGGPSRGEAIFSPDGRRVAAEGIDDRIRVWPVGGGEPLAIDLPWRATGLAFSPDGALLAAGGGVGSEDAVLVVRSDGSGPVAKLSIFGSPESLAFSPDGSHLVGAAFMSPTLLWRTDDWAAKPVVLAGALAGVHQAAFGPRGDRIVTGTFDDRVQVWSLDGREFAGLRQPGGQVVAVSPDGERIATGLADGTARIVRLDGTGDPVVIRGHAGAVQSVSFTPDGRWLATTAEGDPIAHLWLVDWAELTTALRAATNACLTLEQRTTDLDESPETARAAWASCQRRNGR
jgi:WD40 repeat protein